MRDITPEAKAIRSFLNTVSLYADRDELASAETFRAWLREKQGFDVTGPIDDATLERARELRNALRSLARANHDGHEDPEALATVNRIAASLPLGVEFPAPGDARLVPRGDGVDRYLGELLAKVFLAMRDGTWSRIKICAADDCQWAFVDASKNRSRAWCSMKVCGNRAKVRNYQRRRKAQEQGDQA